MDAGQFLAGNAVDGVDPGAVVEQGQFVAVHCRVVAYYAFEVGLVRREGLFVLGLVDSLLEELRQGGIGPADGTALQRFDEVEVVVEAACQQLHHIITNKHTYLIQGNPHQLSPDIQSTVVGITGVSLAVGRR
jgi:hypothetical protein